MLRTLPLLLLVLSIALINGQNAFATDHIENWNIDSSIFNIFNENQTDTDDLEFDDILLAVALAIASFSYAVTPTIKQIAIKLTSFATNFIRAPPVNR